MRIDRHQCAVDSGAYRIGKALQDGQALTERRISYILKTGANWTGPIKRFRLVVDKGHADGLVSFCGKDVRKIGPTTFEMTADDFVPSSDLSILILTAHLAE